MFVLVEDAAEAVMSADVEAGDCVRVGDGLVAQNTLAIIVPYSHTWVAKAETT
jgi:hypothetical protein